MFTNCINGMGVRGDMDNFPIQVIFSEGYRRNLALCLGLSVCQSVCAWKLYVSPRNQDDLKNEESLKDEDDLKNEDDLKTEKDLKNKDNLKTKEDL